MSACDCCVGTEADHHLCDRCVQEENAREDALRAELAAEREKVRTLTSLHAAVEAACMEAEADRARLEAERRDLALKVAERVREACAVQVRGEWIVYEAEDVPNEVRKVNLAALVDEVLRGQ